MISTIRTLYFYAGPLDGIRVAFAMEQPTDVVVVEGYDGHYEYARDISPTHHRFDWQTLRAPLPAPPPITPPPNPY